MTQEQLKEANQLTDTLEYIDKQIAAVEMEVGSLPVFSKTLAGKEINGYKDASISKDYDVLPNLSEELFKIKNRHSNAHLKAMRQYRAKIQAKFNKL